MNKRMVDATFERAVALDLLNQREVAFSKLKQRGVLVLDAPAHQISDPLVEAYLQIKTQGSIIKSKRPYGRVFVASMRATLNRNINFGIRGRRYPHRESILITRGE